MHLNMRARTLDLATDRRGMPFSQNQKVQGKELVLE